MWGGEGDFIERPWMQFIELWLMPIEIGGREREILDDYGPLASMLQQGFMVSHTVG